MIESKNAVDNEYLELELLLEGIFRKYGFDFREYSGAHIKRRLSHRLSAAGMQNFTQILHRIIYDEEFFKQILLDLSINVTEMYRDPTFYLELRQRVIPYLSTYPFIKIWHAGCSAGQEVYSNAILLEEENLLDRSQIYATDFNEKILQRAKEGIYPIEEIRKYTENYQKAGGRNSFSEYYTAHYDSALIKKSLKDNILFSFHNLVTDGVFGEMNMVFCRNVLIYFNKELQNKVLKLFHDSLIPGGFLCLGSKESLKFSAVEDDFEIISQQEKIYRKRR
ncbi:MULTISPECIES: protein-glutamate O-methyltransferase CheR [unclassified Oceanispirochaeta]|uniref:CheR family methyltransferase n=1 Tax=unclassified Oceanispirochaeta TaxID=2635722 RepID=UPI0014951F81|nr:MULTISPECIES: protein-glutamate O-methyltransferase CheR [unclassified Oceanispirochaeta]MBF9017916.1 protein-glutamate O-methyltransferase CheR [Oceanispirochaeta sp. M2]